MASVYCHDYYYYYYDCRKKLLRRLFACCVIFIVTVLFVIFLVWLILRPTKPSFTLRDVTVNQFNITYPNFVTSKLQVSISSRNPNGKIGIYYDKLDIYASYRGQQITQFTDLTPTYQDHKGINDWSPFLVGNEPVASYLCIPLNQDLTTGTLLLNIKVVGRLRWKVGTWISGRYHIYVNCPAYINFGNQNTCNEVCPAMKYELVQVCHTEI